jgi:hypothetical protein
MESSYELSTMNIVSRLKRLADICLENGEWGTRGPLWGLGAMGSGEWGVGSGEWGRRIFIVCCARNSWESCTIPNNHKVGTAHQR